MTDPTDSATQAKLSDKIKAFWEYVASNTHKIDWNELQTATKAYGTANPITNESFRVYEQMLQLFHEIGGDNGTLSLNFRLNKIYIKHPEMVRKIREMYNNNFIIPVLVRYEMIISACGSTEMCELVEQIYAEHWNHQILDEWFVVRYGPPKAVVHAPDLNGNTIELPHFKYKAFTEGNKIDIIITISDDAVEKNIQTQDHIYQIRSALLIYLEGLFGEYNILKHLAGFTVIPESACPNEIRNALKPITDIGEIAAVFAKPDKCFICGISSHNSDLSQLFNESICKYCFDRLSTLGLNFSD